MGVGRIQINVRVLVNFFITGTASKFEVVEGIPKDAKIIGVTNFRDLETLDILLEHPEINSDREIILRSIS